MAEAGLPTAQSRRRVLGGSNGWPWPPRCRRGDPTARHRRRHCSRAPEEKLLVGEVSAERRWPRPARRRSAWRSGPLLVCRPGSPRDPSSSHWTWAPAAAAAPQKGRGEKRPRRSWTLSHLTPPGSGRTARRKAVSPSAGAVPPSPTRRGPHTRSGWRLASSVRARGPSYAP